MIKSAEFNFYNQSGNQNIISTIRAKITHFEAKYFKLKEATTILELALRMTVNDKTHQDVMHKEVRIDQLEFRFRRQCWVTCACGADVANCLAISNCFCR
jgi:hypothetical protein